ncbi:MAG TPA: hypothetical protein DEG47_01105, partial [Cyanobacteria bacterium UBA11148]|nr:hypothetical protein [Cyanobacteria bacterium UBA11148]
IFDCNLVLDRGSHTHKVKIPRFWGVGRPGVGSGEENYVYLTYLRKGRFVGAEYYPPPTL